MLEEQWSYPRPGDETSAAPERAPLVDAKGIA